MIRGIDTSFLIALEQNEHLHHAVATALVGRLLATGDRLALCPQVLDEFVHVVTDVKRFSKSLDIVTARRTAEEWWTAGEVDRVYPNEAAVSQFFSWVDQFKLGRKRLLDTMLAATYFQNRVTSILTINPSDFAVLGVFDCPKLSLPPRQGPTT